jgi:hypothetical protein
VGLSFAQIKLSHMRKFHSIAALCGDASGPNYTRCLTSLRLIPTPNFSSEEME